MLKALEPGALALSDLSEDDLLNADTPTEGRILYCLSLKRLRAFLLRETTSFMQAEGQAKIALAYVKHAEGSNMTVMQLGRSSSDEALQRDIERLRGEFLKIATDKGKEMIGSRKATPKPILVAATEVK